MAAGGDDDELAPAGFIAHRRRLRAGWKAHFPALLAGRGVERAQEIVRRRADEDETAGRRERTPDVRRAFERPERPGRLVARRAERFIPGDLAGREIERDELAPGRRRARHTE